MSITGEEGHAPARMGIPMGDLAGSMFAVFSITSALYQREQTGEGANIDISLLDSLASMLTYVAEYYFVGNQISKPIGSGHMSVVPYRAYETQNGFLVIAVFVEKFWQILCDVIGEHQLGSDERFNSTAKRLEHRDEVDALLEKKFIKKTKEEWIRLLHKAGVPAAPVNRIDEVFKDPQVLARDMLVELEHPKCGKYKMIGNPVKVEGVSDEFRPPPLLGEHTNEVLKKLLGENKD
jgi:formyl-CoA transferase/CoA:oxalate CoA-transferase